MTSPTDTYHALSAETADLFRRLESEMPANPDIWALKVFDISARAAFHFSSPETEVLRLLSEDEITLNKAREWLSEWIIQGIRGPLPPTADGQGWRPIETAPKDQRILVCGMKRLDYAVARFTEHDDWEMELTHDWQGIYTPKFWKPLDPMPCSSWFDGSTP